MVIEMHKENDKFFIKDIVIGLPTSNSNSAEIEQDFIKFMRSMNVTEAPNPSPSEKKIKILGMGPMLFKSGERALMLKYQTDINLDDTVALRKEADSIWQSFRNDVEKADMKIGIIKACEVPKGTLIKANRSYNFVFKKDESGIWHCGGNEK